MNSGKICVSVFADTAGELIEKLRRAEPLADVVELRFDGLDREGIRTAFEQLTSEKQLLLTMRPKEQGGRAPMNLSERIGFWNEFALHKSIDHSSVWIDLEYDLIPEKDFMFWLDQCVVVRSKHYPDGQIADLNRAYETVVSAEEVGKIAVPVSDSVEAIGIWNTLQRASADDKRLVAIAMGEPGKWTRILGPAHGAFMTYAALEYGGETAAGQISAEDMVETYRVRDLNKQTNVYGIIAGNTSYSISPWMHNAAFKVAGLNSVFVPLQTSDVGELIERMVRHETREVELNFAGLSVTNPHKEAIIEHLDEVDHSAAEIGAVNTVKIEAGKLKGFNTDAEAFISTLKAAAGDLDGRRVAIFGAGGAARACAYALVKEGAEITVFARNEQKGRALADRFGCLYEISAGDRQMGGDFDVVVNTTPLGTAGSNENFAALSAPQLSGLKMVYDLVYNPRETTLIKEAHAAGVPGVGGLDMLIAQGARQFEIWTGLEAPVAEMRAAVERRLDVISNGI
jgi:3-dehydroquinate dehydratase / shikimate dehydrogenase